MLLDQGQELVLLGTHDGRDRLAVLDEVEGRHRLDLVGRGDFLHFVHVHLQEDDLSELLGVFDEQWGDGAAWTAPGGSEVDDHLKGSASLTELHVRGGRVATLTGRKRRYYTGVHSAVLGPTVRVQRRSTDNCAPSEDNDKDKNSWLNQSIRSAVQGSVWFLLVLD